MGKEIERLEDHADFFADLQPMPLVVVERNAIKVNEILKSHTPEPLDGKIKQKIYAILG